MEQLAPESVHNCLAAIVALLGPMHAFTSRATLAVVLKVSLLTSYLTFRVKLKQLGTDTDTMSLLRYKFRKTGAADQSSYVCRSSGNHGYGNFERLHYVGGLVRRTG